MNLKRANEDLWKMAWHLSITTNRIREVMICPLEVLIPLNKEGNLQAIFAAQPLLFTVQHCSDGSAVSFSPLLTSTTIFTDGSIQVHLYILSVSNSCFAVCQKLQETGSQDRCPLFIES